MVGAIGFEPFYRGFRGYCGTIRSYSYVVRLPEIAPGIPQFGPEFGPENQSLPGLLIRRFLVRAQVGEPEIKHLPPTDLSRLIGILDVVRYRGVCLCLSPKQ